MGSVSPRAAVANTSDAVRAKNVVMADLRHRGHVAQPDAGRPHHANAWAGGGL